MNRKLPAWINGIHGHVKVVFKDDETVISPEREDGNANADC